MTTRTASSLERWSRSPTPALANPRLESIEINPLIVSVSATIACPRRGRRRLTSPRDSGSLGQGSKCLGGGKCSIHASRGSAGASSWTNRCRRRRAVELQHDLAAGGYPDNELQAARAAAREAGQPRHMAAPRRQPDDRLRPRAGERDASHLQLERLPVAEDQEGLRQGVRRRGRGDVLHHARRGDLEDQLGAVEFDVFFPTPDRSDGSSSQRRSSP